MQVRVQIIDDNGKVVSEQYGIADMSLEFRMAPPFIYLGPGREYLKGFKYEPIMHPRGSYDAPTTDQRSP